MTTPPSPTFDLSVFPSVAEILASSPPRRVRCARPESARSIAPAEGEANILELYLAEVARTPLLTSEQENLIARRAQAGDSEALDELVTRNLRFVISVAKKYQNRGMALVDLIGEGNVGLMIAARKYDPDQGVKFISYAVWWIRQSILSSLARTSRSVRLPLNRTADLSKVMRTAELLRQDLSREPTPEEISVATGLTLEIVLSLVTLNTAEVRFDAPLESSSDLPLLDRFMIEQAEDTESIVMERLLIEEVRKALRTLPPRDARILTLYFGLEGETEHTLEEIGTMMGITRERIRQVRDRALSRLSVGATGMALQSFA